MTLTASIQPLVSVLRLHPHGGDWRSRSAYDWAATAVHVDAETVELMGVDRPLNGARMRAIARALAEQGYRRVRRRRPDGSEHHYDVAQLLRIERRRRAED